MVALFDHEEVGSDSAQGAGSPAMLDALSRITGSFNSSNSRVLTDFHYARIKHIFLFQLVTRSVTFIKQFCFC